MITSELFGTAPCGTPVHRYTLNGPEICVRIMDYGATVLGIDVPDIPGNVRDVVLGFDKLEDYFDNPACFGATIGPVANRTAGATITIDGTDWHMPANEGVNNLHSDLEHGLHKRVWDVELDETHNAVRMTTSLKYFNLAGHNAGMDCEHFFIANAAHYLPINEQNIPTGEIAPVEGTPFDFRELRPVAPGMEADDPQIKQARGYDHCLCIDGYQYGRNLRRALHVEEMWTGRELDYYTTAPGVQLYTGNWLGDEHAKDDANYGWGAGFALEAEMYPDTPHQPLFPQGIVGPGHPYSNMIEYHFMRH
ncbi:MAG: galactose mutarotase [Collinsella sp.]|nr:galactose mutarotase [Collinsella sp.]